MGKKWERCVKSVKRHSGKKYNPYAVCTKSVGRLNAKKMSKGSKFMDKGGKGVVSILGLFAKPLDGSGQDLFMGTIHKKKK
jgi:hypothetical protein